MQTDGLPGAAGWSYPAFSAYGCRSCRSITPRRCEGGASGSLLLGRCEEGTHLQAGVKKGCRYGLPEDLRHASPRLPCALVRSTISCRRGTRVFSATTVAFFFNASPVGFVLSSLRWPFLSLAFISSANVVPPLAASPLLPRPPLLPVSLLFFVRRLARPVVLSDSYHGVPCG